VTYDHLGSRVHTIGPMTLVYDRLGSRAKTVVLPDDPAAQPTGAPIPVEHLLALYFVLHHVQVEEQQRRNAQNTQ
jgi:hypothetical protein